LKTDDYQTRGALHLAPQAVRTCLGKIEQHRDGDDRSQRIALWALRWPTGGDRRTDFEEWRRRRFLEAFHYDPDRKGPVGIVPVDQVGGRDGELCRRGQLAGWELDPGREDVSEDLGPATSEDVKLAIWGCLGGVAKHEEFDSVRYSWRCNAVVIHLPGIEVRWRPITGVRNT
jgi:hypothetical protein